MKNLLIFSLILIGICSCEKSNEADSIQDYITENNLVLTETESGLFYDITDNGNGVPPIITDIVTVRFQASFIDGVIFETSGSDTYDLDISNQITGLEEALLLMPRGSAGFFIIPSSLAYGRNGTNGIPGNTPLIYDIQMVDF